MVTPYDVRLKQSACAFFLLVASSVLPAHASQQPTEFTVLCSQQKALVFKREYPQALDFVNAMIAGGEQLPMAYKLRAETFTAMRLYDNAVADANQAIELDPNFRPAYVTRATVYMRMRDYGKAIVAWQQSLQHVDRSAPQSSALVTDSTASRGSWEQTNLGYIYARQGDYGAAVSAYNAAISLEPNNCTEAYFFRGLVHEQQGRLKESIADYAQALRQDTGFLPALQHAAVVSEVLGQANDAASYNAAFLSVRTNAFTVRKQYQLVPEMLTDAELSAWKAADEKFKNRG